MSRRCPVFSIPDQYIRAFNELSYATDGGELRRIDRVVEFEHEIWILDYKTGDTIDAGCAEVAARPYRKQLMEYSAAVTKLMPGKTVKSALIFSGGLLVESIDRRLREVHYRPGAHCDPWRF